MAEDAYGWNEVVATREAAVAALKLASPGLTFGGHRDAVWRARDDGVIELARANWGRVELFEVHGDSTSRMVAASSRSLNRVAAHASAWTSAVLLVGGVLAAFVLSPRFVVLTAAVFILFPLSFLLNWGSDVRPWAAEHSGTDEWAPVPWQIDGEPTTGNQSIALSALVQTARVHYRVADDGALEVVARRKEVEVLHMDRHGRTTLTESLPKKRFDLAELRGPEVTWHEVLETDPSD